MNTICFGQQPSGFFPKKFLVAKIRTAKKLQTDVGGKIVFFYHDSDADYRETITVLRDLATGAEVRLNFTQENKIQKKFSPLSLKRIPQSWTAEILKQLPRFVDRPVIDMFKSVQEKTVADFCLSMYQKLRLLDGVEVVRSSDKSFRSAASNLDNDYFADVEYEGEVVRAKIESTDGQQMAVLHEGGDQYTRFPISKPIEKWQKNPGKDQRFGWMNSVIHCTHYIYGEGEAEYLKFSDFPEVTFIPREEIAHAELAWLP